jgi:acetyltransferase-like isoleucine patch superfamily enzyme
VVGALVSVGPNPRVHPVDAIIVEPGCELGQGVELNPWGGRIRLGKRVFVGPYVVVYGHGGVEIGENTLISMHCRILSSNHTVPPRDAIIRNERDILLPTKIGRDCWLGAGVTVLGGVEVGDGCVVGAGTVVTKNLPSHSISHGVPARVVGERP